MTRGREVPHPSISEVVEHFGGRVMPTRTGGWQPVRCPLHEDRSPSASLNEDACKFVCFPCDFKGDALDLIGRATGVTRWADLVRYAEAHFGAGDTPVRSEPGAGGELLVRPRNHGGGSTEGAPWLRF